MKIFDCFLFYNELDLLELRLNLLYKHIDYFVIIESEVTFQGQQKDFNFDKNKQRFEKFIDKIIYYKIPTYKFDFTQLPIIKNPLSDDEIILNKIYELVESSNEFDKTHFWWGNESYQRETIWRALNSLKPDDSDLILLSDADEIISPDSLINIKKNIDHNKVYTCKQHEFYYYLNYYHHSNWFGQIAFKFGSFKYKSLNKMRSLRTAKNFEYDLVILENAGWHFTSLGTIKNITEKIKSWGHKEFNNRIVINSLNYNIKYGYDIFRRTSFGKLTYLDVDDNLLEPISKFFPKLSSSLIGPKIPKENIIKKFIFSMYFKVANRLYHFTS